MGCTPGGCNLPCLSSSTGRGGAALWVHVCAAAQYLSSGRLSGIRVALTPLVPSPPPAAVIRVVDRVSSVLAVDEISLERRTIRSSCWSGFMSRVLSRRPNPPAERDADTAHYPHHFLCRLFFYGFFSNFLHSAGFLYNDVSGFPKYTP